MKEWLGNKSNQYLVILVASIISIILLIMSIVSTLDKMNVKGLYPTGDLSREQETHPGYEPLADISCKCLFSSLKYSCDMPIGTKIDGDYASCEYEGMYFVAVVGEADIEKMCEETLPRMFYIPIVGKKTKAEEAVKEAGYLFDKSAKFQAYTISTKVSTKEKIAYTMCYEITSKNSQRVLYLYALVEDKDMIDEAYVVLRQIALSVTPIEDVGVWMEENVINGQSAESAETDIHSYEVESPYENKVIVEDEEGPFDIYIELVNDRELVEGVLLVEWANFQCVPYRLDLYDEEGNFCSMDKEYSVAGHYVYEIGSANGGVYTLQGGTMDKLTGGKYYFLELEQYEVLYQAAQLIPHE